MAQRTTKNARRRPKTGAVSTPKPKAMLTRQELAGAIGVHPDTVAGWAADEDMPVAQRGRGGKPSLYDLGAVLAWRKAREEAERAGPLDPVQEKARRDHWQATLAEQTWRVRNGKLLAAEEVEKAWLSEVAAVRAKLLAVPTTYADRVFRAGTLDGVGGVERLLKEAVHGALRELAGGRAGEAAA
jgi:phage terminase Nu1 subunit (DNA packaging protein)